MPWMGSGGPRRHASLPRMRQGAHAKSHASLLVTQQTLLLAQLAVSMAGFCALLRNNHM
jgi:hypothetical protein